MTCLLHLSISLCGVIFFKQGEVKGGLKYGSLCLKILEIFILLKQIHYTILVVESCYTVRDTVLSHVTKICAFL
jgi:hypothetical protein